MRIGVMLRALVERGGIRVYAMDILKNLLEIDKNNQYILFYQGKKTKTSFSGYPNVEEQWINVPYKILWDQVFIPFFAVRARIDLLFNPKFSVPFISPCKIVMVLHGTQNYVYPEFYKPRDVLYLKLMMPLYLGRAAKTIVVSEKSKEDIVKFTGVNKSKVIVVHLAAEDIFNEAVDPVFVERVKAKYDLPSRYILHVGVIYPGKNIERVIQVFAKIAKKFPHKLVLAGGFKWREDRVFNLIERLDLKDKIIMVKWISHSELRVFYNLADLLIFPSFYESFGMPVLEAMACGCPVVTSSTGSMPEIVEDAALMVDPTNVDQIYRAMVRVLEDRALKAKLIRAGLARFKKFSWEKSARETLSVFKEIVEEKEIFERK